MATVKRRAWDRYSSRQAAQRKAASDEMYEYIVDADTVPTKAAVIAVGTRLAVKHGRSSAALACVWYDQVARLSDAEVPKAVPAVVANSGRIGALVEKATPALEVGDVEYFAKQCGVAVANEVKRSASVTMKKNAKRDNAQFAWIPQGSETCAFCMVIASNGWTYARKETVENHEDHIHPNCECEFAIRFDNSTNVAGYDPSYYEGKYDNADGRNAKDKINAIRRDEYAKHADEIKAQQRENYARRTAERE